MSAVSPSFLSRPFLTLAGVVAASGLTVTQAFAGQVVVDVEIPQQKVAEYHKPYVAGWIEDASGAHLGNAFLWYDVKKPENRGAKWLKDLRSWWRKSGRDLSSTDGFSGATRAPGRNALTLDSNLPLFKNLKPGQYSFVVEASREQAGHEVVKVPLAWNPAKATTGKAKGSTELGEVKVTYKP
ncbi:DUF2271 domain-containing protein [Asticcacaulis sp. 201]|uniref:DUF2271 domain-containing protein n=1 Tax=Asticcacaulis sp. 201 TaxID=3028787 RepID=UPI0029162368|nr:DUF2271 domain-containing protein [Asticcacaulis sp. 201]MDV6330254.1 DUF2271 domain-containing protein [Asticcacaulis sp. 201]